MKLELADSEHKAQRQREPANPRLPIMYSHNTQRLLLSSGLKTYSFHPSLYMLHCIKKNIVAKITRPYCFCKAQAQ